MNFSLLDKILESQDAVLVTILATTGHSYQKAGSRALFREGDAIPLWGNLGSLCIDQSILEAGERAIREGRPVRTHVDTSDEADALIGTGTACGGTMELLIEPVAAPHRLVYQELRDTLAGGTAAVLSHHLTTGALTLGRAGNEDTHLIEEFVAPPQLFLFGATPLARMVLRMMAELDFSFHLVDWRPDMLATFSDVPRLTRREDFGPFDSRSYVLVMSHSFERDLGALEAAIRARAHYLGVLSSRSRRSLMFAELERRGAAGTELARIHSPVGLDIGARSDAEIAVSIAAQIIGASR